ncbi:hypothetical protein [Halogranum rubrum]|uniref:hypothetical protein n=1 Tax=Halogranum rubrum TaxID=553466 RepID=UPI000B7E6513|nr:hypothetical protein [Halogranum rubrum]
MPRARRDPESLRECFEPRLLPSIRDQKRRLHRVRRALLSRSPYYFARGDMRREYGWTRALLTAGATVAGVALAFRLVLTGLFVTLVSAEISLVLLFNVCVSLLLGRALLDRIDTEPRTYRRVVGPRPPWVRSTISRRRRGRRWRQRRHRRQSKRGHSVRRHRSALDGRRRS